MVRDGSILRFDLKLPLKPRSEMRPAGFYGYNGLICLFNSYQMMSFLK